MAGGVTILLDTYDPMIMTMFQDSPPDEAIGATFREPDDFQFRVTVRALIAAVYEATYQWTRSRSRESIGQLMNRAVDIVHGQAHLEALPRVKPRRRQGATISAATGPPAGRTLRLRRRG